VLATCQRLVAALTPTAPQWCWQQGFLELFDVLADGVPLPRTPRQKRWCGSTDCLCVSEWRALPGYTAPHHTTARATGAGEDNGIDHTDQTWLRFPYDSTFVRSHLSMTCFPTRTY
jgi:hypothetical protein